MKKLLLVLVIGITSCGGDETTKETEWGKPPQCALSYACATYNLCHDNGQCNCFDINDCWLGEPWNSTHVGYLSCCE